MLGDESRVLVVKTGHERKPLWSASKSGLACVLVGCMLLVALVTHSRSHTHTTDVEAMSAATVVVMPSRVGSTSLSSRSTLSRQLSRKSVAYVPSKAKRGDRVVRMSSQKEMRDRIKSVGNTQKITDAMKLVAAAKVRRAQDAVISARPFSDQLVKVLFAINGKLSGEDVESPLTRVRPVKTVMLLVFTADRGLCGGFNNYVLKKAEQRVAELEAMGIACKIVSVGKKGNSFWKRRPAYDVVKTFEMGQLPSTDDAQHIADAVYAEYVSEEVDKVELVYSRFISLISSEPMIQTMLPLSAKGEICDINGECVDAADDEIFRLTSEGGKLAVEREGGEPERAEFEGVMQFEQNPQQILDSIMPLYLNSVMLRALQESVASELAARMTAMSTASDNAKDLKKKLNLEYNRKRQAKITSEIIELVAGSQ